MEAWFDGRVSEEQPTTGDQTLGDGPTADPDPVAGIEQAAGPDPVAGPEQTAADAAEQTAADAAEQAKAAEPARPQKIRASASIRPAMLDEPDPVDAWAAPRPPGRAWYLPVVIGIVALVLIVGIAYLLVSHASDNGTAAPPAPPAPTVDASAVPVGNGNGTPQEAGAAPSPPSALPSVPPASGPVLVPDVTQIFLDDAQHELTAFGFVPVLEAQESTTYMANVVISTVPSAGTPVTPGTTIVVVYAVPPEGTSPTPSATASASPALSSSS